MTALYVGLDLGSSTCHQVVMQVDGQIIINRRFSTSEAPLLDAFTGIGGQLHVHLEAGCRAPQAPGRAFGLRRLPLAPDCMQGSPARWG